MKRHAKSVAILVALLALYLFVAISLSPGDGQYKPDYTVFSTAEDGACLLFDALKELKYPVEISLAQVNSLTALNDVAIIIEPSPQYFSEDDIETLLLWVSAGGRLIMMEESGWYIEDRFGTLPYYEDDYFQCYDYGMGEAVIGYSSDVVNLTLKDDAYAGSFIQSMLDEWGAQRVLFCEYYHGFRRTPGFLRILPPELKIAVYQLALAAIAVVWLKGKRFGRPVPYYEEIEREENEFVKALALIYKNAGRGEAALKSRYDSFMHSCASFFGVSSPYARENIIELWREKDLPGMSGLLEARGFIESGERCNTKRRAGRRELMRLMRILDGLAEQVDVKYE